MVGGIDFGEKKTSDLLALSFASFNSVCVCVCERERESVCVCVKLKGQILFE